MESKIKASFIPKKPIAQKPRASIIKRRGSGVDLIMLIAIVLIAVASVLSVGVFLYKNIAQQEEKNKKERLQKSRDSFDPALIKKMQKLSTRIEVAQEILDNHIAPSAFLQTLEKITLSGVQFTEFNFKPKNNEVAEFSMKGKAGSVNSIALQSAKFSTNDMIKTSIFSDIDLVNSGVTFNVSGELDLDTIRFADVSNNTFSQSDNQINNMPTFNDLINSSQDTELDFGAFDNIQ